MPTATRTPKRREDRERTVARIVSAALALFRAKGIGNVTYGDVARRARISRPLVYFYFPEMQHLLAECLLTALADLGVRFAAAVKTGRTGLESTEAIGRAYLQFHRERPDLFFICTAVNPRRVPDDASDLNARLEAADHAVMGLLTGSIERGMKDGSIRKDAGPTTLVALCLWSMTHGMAQFTSLQAENLATNYGTEPKALLEQGMDLLRAALRPST